MKKKFSVILPIYGNEKNLPVTVPYIMERTELFENYDFELVMVCDGSPDNSWELMKKYQAEYPAIIKIANLTRNFGQSGAIRCGMELATGDVVGVISADLQDPYELFVDMLKEWECGSKVVIATRRDRDDKGLGTCFSKAFHRIINHHVNKDYPIGGFDFFLLDAEAKREYCTLDQQPSSMQLLILSLGHRRSFIEYVRAKREHGKSGYNFASKMELAIRVVVTWSDYPIKKILSAGFLMTLIAMFLGVVDAGLFWIFSIDIYASMDFLLIIAAFFGILLMSIAIIGEYIYRTFEIVNKRPRYMIDECIDSQSKDME